MALVRYGGGIAQMSGSLGGNTYAHNRSGNYVRTRTKPVNPNTDLQTKVRAAMAFLTDRWSQTLTGAQRAAWNLYASNVVMKNRLGVDINLSGFNHYIRSNMIRKQTTTAIIDDGPVVFEIPASDPTYAITASEATQVVSNAFDITMDWATEAGAYMYFFQGVPQNPQRNFFNGPWRLSGALAGADPGPLASPKDRPAVFAFAEGQRLWGYARISRADGRLSSPFQDSVLVDA
jgi:hypothetical protein